MLTNKGRLFSLQTDGVALSTSPEERRVGKVLRRTKKEIHKLRLSNSLSAGPDIVSFRYEVLQHYNIIICDNALEYEKKNLKLFSYCKCFNGHFRIDLLVCP